MYVVEGGSTQFVEVVLRDVTSAMFGKLKAWVPCRNPRPTDSEGNLRCFKERIEVSLLVFVMSRSG